jgi:protein-disulfide isomerase
MKLSSNTLSNAFTGILATCAIIMTGLCVNQYFTNRSTNRSERSIDDWQELLTGRKIALGNDRSKLKIIEFTDYQCPYCRSMEPVIESMVDASAGKVAVVRYDLPLVQAHEHAMDAAIAERCAEQFGIGRDYSRQLYMADLSKIDYASLARNLGLRDENKFEKCVYDPKIRTRIDHDIAVAKKYDINSTPTFIINGKVIKGLQTREQLESQLTSEGR